MCCRYSCQNGYAILAQVPPPKWLFQKTLFSADSAPSPMECETGSLDTFSLVDAASSTGDDFWVLDTPKSRHSLLTQLTHCRWTPCWGRLMWIWPRRTCMLSCRNSKTRCHGWGSTPGFVKPKSSGSQDVLSTLGPWQECGNLFDWGPLIPPLPESAARYARAVTHGELKSLLTEFDSNSWTASLVARILEIYVIAKQSEEYDAFLKVKHTSKKGGSMGYLKENEPGSQASPLICAGCNAPWVGLKKSASSCKSTGTADLSITPLSVIEVDGQVWQLRFSDSGPAWVLSDPKDS